MPAKTAWASRLLSYVLSDLSSLTQTYTIIRAEDWKR